MLYQSKKNTKAVNFKLSNIVSSTKCENKAILVVEDNIINQTIVKRFLQEKHYKFDIASAGEEALRLFSQNQYSAILMDVGLPGISGIEVTEIIRKIEKTTKTHIPIIALTAEGIQCKKECLQSGMDDFSIKPFDFEELALKIESLINI
jgi:CheY-like chemotaxis protein